MRILIRSAALATIMGAQAFAQSGTVTPVGTWLTEDGRAKIKMEHCGEANDKLCGFVAWMRDPLNDKGQPKTDIKNPDPAKRNRPSLGMELMAGLKADDDTHYAGEIYNAEDGKTYTVTISTETAAELKVHGCMLKFLCGSQTWTRVADVALPTGTKVVSTATASKATPKVAPAHAAHDNQAR